MPIPGRHARVPAHQDSYDLSLPPATGSNRDVSINHARPARERLLFLDAVRGWVLIFMVLNKGWQEARRWYREPGPALGVFGRA